MVDKDLFLHDLAVVAILKNEGPYLKEWIDYHLLAGVDHFYLYDNESSDNQAEVAKPYVEAGLVDYFPLLGQAMQKKAYNYAINQFKFHCRYMAFINGDEFIFPKVNGILKYRDARAKVYQPPDNSHVEERLLSALERNLSPTLLPDTPLEFYAGKVETFLTCRAVASYLQTKLSDTAQVKLYEEAALKAILKSLQTRYIFADAGLLVQELPTLLKLPYPVVEELRKV